MIEQLLVDGARKLGIELTGRQVEQFEAYTSLLLEWNDRFNLTSITDPAEIVTKHFLDSLTCLTAAKFPKGAVVADIGTGAGFPGVPIAIVRPDLKIVMIDATKKKLAFLDEIRKTILSNHHPAILSLSKDERLEGEPPRIELVHARAEEVGRLPEHRERYDAVVARAVAEMRVLAEYCLPLVKVGGKFIAMKGPDIDAELAKAKPGIGTLGGSRPEVVRLTLPGTDIGRSLVIIRKTKPTPEQFPRHGSQITKRPL